MAKILLDEQIIALFSYDPETGEILSRQGHVLGSKDFEGYVRVKLGGRSGPVFRAHRLAFLAMLGHWPKLYVDHINGCRSDNRWSNLREVDRRTNSQNQRVATRNNKTSGVLGVSWAKTKGGWYAQIVIDGRAKNLGVYSSIEEARSAYLNAKRQFHIGCTI